ncbi:DUF4192 family protein [Agromyces sp. G08B096]|uniref:DUF4192 family protein n=1 Tax=Agromyces sp. G08B096 TaxID=3156399 RepID=A0AAU7W5A2_9MICO
MTTIIRADRAHDFLALLPRIAGYTPERSLVWVAFRGARTRAVARFDLPRRAADRDALVAASIGLLCRLEGVDAVVPVVYSDAAFRGRRGSGEAALLRLAVRRAEEAGFLVRDALRVACDAWGSLLDPATPAAGRDLGLIAASAVCDDLPDEDAPSASVARLGVLPDANAAERQAVESELRSLELDERRGGDRFVDAISRLGGLADPVALVEFLLDADCTGECRHRIAPHVLAWLVHLAALPRYRDALMLQIAFGPDIGSLALDEPEDEPDHEPDDELDDELDDKPEDDEEDVAVGHEHQHARRADVEGAAALRDLLSRLLVGQTRERPDAARVEHGLALLRRAASVAPERSRAGVLCMAAWLAWSRARGSAAAALLELAEDAEPGYPMATLLLRLLGTGALPEWSFVEPSAEVSARPADRWPAR